MSYLVNRKREREEEQEVDISSLTCASPVRKVQGVVLNVSPLKKSKMGNSYFDGQISDGIATMRFVGYDTKVRRRIVELEGKDVTLSRCEIKTGRQDGDGLELHLRNTTEVAKSEKTFDVSNEIDQKDVITDVGVVHELVQYQRVTVEGKVVELDVVKEVSGGKKKQDLVIGDSSGSTRLTVWEEVIGKVAEGKSYRFTGMMVREFKGKKFLSTSKSDSKVEEIADIGEVEVDEEEEVEEGGSGGLEKLVNGVRVVGVDRLTLYNGCLKCSSKVEVDVDDEEVGECIKCKMIQSMDDCKRSILAQMTVKLPNCFLMTLRAFDRVVLDIIQDESENVTAKMLIKAKSFSMYHRNGIMQSISRDTQ